jgi:hypothetical protein
VGVARDSFLALKWLSDPNERYWFYAPVSGYEARARSVIAAAFIQSKFDFHLLQYELPDPVTFQDESLCMVAKFQLSFKKTEIDGIVCE